MKRLFAILCGTLLALAPLAASAGTMTLLGAGSAPSGGGYTGPGDVVASATHFWGFRAYSAATATANAKAAALIRSDSHTCDVLLATTGDLGVTANCSTSGENGTAVATWCNATTCKASTLYDQVGTADMVQSTGSAQMALSFGCTNGKTCLIAAGAQQYQTTISAVPQPFTVSAVALRTSGAGQGSILNDANGNTLVFFNSTANQVAAYFGSTVSAATASDSAWHALQFVITGASSTINVDGTATAASPGTNQMSANWRIASEGTVNWLTGDIAEVGFWPSTFSSGQQASMCHNQYAYWGTSASC